MKHPEDTWRRAWLVDDHVGEDPVKQNRSAGEIGTAVADPRHLGQPVKGVEKRRDDPVRRFQAFAFQQVKPNGVDVENGIFGKLKRFQRCFAGPDLNPPALIYV